MDEAHAPAAVEPVESASGLVDGGHGEEAGAITWSWTLRGFPWSEVMQLLHWGSFLVGLGYGIASAVLVTLTPRIVPFSQDDLSIALPDKGDTISSAVVVLAPFALCFVLLILFEFFILRAHNKTFAVAVFAGANLLLRIIETYLGTVVLQQLSAVLTGALRPEFLAICMPNAQNQCTNTDQRAVDDARKSYFSGHASTAMCISSFCGMYLLYSYYVRLPRRPPGQTPDEHAAASQKPRGCAAVLLRELADGLVFLVASCTLIASMLVSVSRVIDGKHSRPDVNAGMLIGFFFSAMFFPRFVILNERGIAKLQSFEKPRSPDTTSVV